MEFNAAVNKNALQHQLRLHFRQLELRILKVRQPFAEGLPLAGIGHGPFKGGFGACRRSDRLQQPFLRQFCYKLEKPVALDSQQIVDRDTDIVEEQFRRVHRLATDFVQRLTQFKAGPVGFNDNKADALAAGRGIRFRRQNDEIGILRITDEGFLPIDDIVIAVPDCGGSHGLQVAAAGGFCHGDGANDFAARHAGKKPLFLGFRAIGQDIWRNNVRVQGEGWPAGSRAAQFLHDNRTMQECAADAAVLFGNCAA